MKNFLNLLAKISMATGVMLISVLTTTSQAQAYDDQDKAILEQKINIMKQSIQSSDFTPVINMISPKVMAEYSQKAGMPVDDFKQQLIKLSNQSMTYLTEMTYLADIDNARVGTTEVGRDYVVIPTKAQMIIDGIGVYTTGTLLAFEDADKWYMMRIEMPKHLEILENAYPDMHDIEFFETTVDTFEVTETTP